MKRIAFLLAALLTLGGCSSDSTRTRQGEPSPAANDEQLFTQAASNLVAQFRDSLQSTLIAALNEKGTAYAVQICESKAREIAAAHSIGGWQVGRASVQWRHVSGRPDSTETAVLARFADPSNADDHIVLTTGPDSARTFHYYEKIVVREMCLQCHGDIRTNDENLWKLVRILYAFDKAVNYKVGDVRGMFVVDAPFPGGAEVARRLAQGVAMREIAASFPPKDSTTAQ